MLATTHQIEADALQVEIYRRMTPARRWELAVGLQRLAREVMDSGLRRSHPHFTAEERRREVARRIQHARS